MRYIKEPTRNTALPMYDIIDTQARMPDDRVLATGVRSEPARMIVEAINLVDQMRLDRTLPDKRTWLEGCTEQSADRV